MVKGKQSTNNADVGGGVVVSTRTDVNALPCYIRNNCTAIIGVVVRCSQGE